MTTERTANTTEHTLAELEGRVHRQQAQITRLLEEIAGIRAAADVTVDRQPDVSSDALAPDPEHRPGDGSDAPGLVSRRGALRALGGVAAGGVGMAIGSAVLGAQPAAAADGDNLVLGQGNSASAETDLTNAGTGSGLSVVLGSASGIDPSPAALVGDSNSQSGVQGASSTDDGVGGYTTADGSSGVSGTDASTIGGYGVSGTSTVGTGVSGSSTYGPGILGSSSHSNGINGSTTADGQSGVQAQDDSSGGGYGVSGTSTFGTGVYGASSGGDGVDGSTTANGKAGVSGTDTSTDGGTGVSGRSTNGTGVYGQTHASGIVVYGVHGDDVSTGGSAGVFGGSSAGTGVEGYGNIGVAGSGVSYGVQAINDGGLPLQLAPPAGVTALPTGPLVVPGTFAVLTDGSLHYCQTEGEWIPLSQGVTVPISPVRVIDTTDGTGGITGPLVAGTTVHTSSAIAGTHGIPAGAVGLVGNFAISGVNGALLNGFGVATIFPAGEATPPTANINAGANCYAISNLVTVGLGTGADAGKVSIVWGGGGAVPDAHAFLDVTAYIV